MIVLLELEAGAHVRFFSSKSIKVKGKLLERIIKSVSNNERKTADKRPAGIEQASSESNEDSSESSAKISRSEITDALSNPIEEEEEAE